MLLKTFMNQQEIVRMPMITIQPPYADLIATGHKITENRNHLHPWQRLSGKWIGIHSGKSRAWMRTAGEIPDIPLHFGGVVAVARLFAVETLLAVASDDRFADWKHHSHTHGPICLLLKDVQPIEFLPMQGYQGVWYVEGSLL